MTAGSPEAERRALLERMHASRAVWRSRLTLTELAARDTGAFPRSRTFRFLTKHPYAAASGLLAMGSILPKGSLTRVARGGAALAAGVFGSKTGKLVLRQLLPPMMSLLRSRRRARPHPGHT
jgi:hypothetical protein